MERIKGLPIIIDVTHTAAGAKALADDIGSIYGKTDIVLGMLKDKDARSMAENLSRIAGKVYISALDTERTADPQTIKDAFGDCSLKIEICGSVPDAMDRAMRSRKDGTNILVTGSFHTAEEALAWLRIIYPGYWTYSQRNTEKEHIQEDRRKV
jgi:dihydrofolate synthase/folylpolyglutamate synthase